MASVAPPSQADALNQAQPAVIGSSQVNSSLILSGRAWVILSLILPIFAVAPLFYPGYLQTHSGLAPLWNVADLRANLGDINWRPHLAVRFDPLRADGLLLYYLAALLPFSAAAAVKLVTGMAGVLGSLGLLLWLRRWLGGPGALVAALVYTYLPYHLALVYVRGAWGENLFWGLLPWAILGATSLTTGHNKLARVSAALLWLLLGLSQLGLTLWALVFTVLLLTTLHPRQSFWPLLSAVLGAAAAAIIYLGSPPNTLFNPSPISFNDQFLYPSQLFSAYWGFGSSRPGWNDGLSFQLGLAALGLALLGLFLRQGSTGSIETSAARTDRRLIFFWATAGLLALLQFPLAGWLWRSPIWPGQTLAGTLTYPWQLIGLIGLCLAVLAGASVWLAPEAQLTRLPVLGSILILVVLSVYPYLSPQFMPLEPYPLDQPQAELGQAQLTVLNHHFTVVISGQTAGLEIGETTIPLSAHGPLQAGDSLVLNLAWQPLQPFEQDLKVFVHLVDPNDNILAQFDGQPKEGAYPTSHWIPGEIIEDAYLLRFPADAPPGPYRVFIGLYDEPTLQRLPVPTDSAGRVIFNVQ